METRSYELDFKGKENPWFYLMYCDMRISIICRRLKKLQNNIVIIDKLKS